jgi:signal transduction histidine kinase
MEKGEILTAILFTTLVLLLLAAFLLLVMLRYRNRKNQYIKERQELQERFEQQLMQAKLEVQEQTLSDLGQEIHDNVGQLLSSTKMLLGATERKLGPMPETFRTAEATLSKAIQDLRALSKSMSKEWLQQFDLVSNLKIETERLSTAGIEVSLETSHTILPLDAERQVVLFRIVQEALHNSMKHAKARHITIAIHCKQHIEIELADDGKGFSFTELNNNGSGIMHMKYRTELLGGTIDWTSKQDEGTKVTITIPSQTDCL